MHPTLRALGLAAALVFPGASARADLLVGQTADFSGPSAVSVKECTDGARLYIDAVNAQGGVHGQKIDLVALDDAFEPRKAAENARKLIDQGAVALFLTRGTPHTQAVLPLLAQFQVPLVAPSTGAMALHRPVNPWVFNVRSSYQHEAERVIVHLHTIGVTRLAIVQVDDSFGADAVQGALRGLAANGASPVAHVKFDRSRPDFAALMPGVLKDDPQAVLFIGSSGSVADGIAQLRAAGSHAQAVTLSNNASAGFVKALGANARGVIVSQVFPYERAAAFAFVREAQDLAKHHGIEELTPQMLEGFAGAKVLVEALRRAGPAPTRASVEKALEGMSSFDLGGLTLGYGPGDHTGLDFVDLAIVDAQGHYRR
jgi:ABC-type branched-subunit amino acid transport system substrate-binding protein